MRKAKYPTEVSRSISPTEVVFQIFKGKVEAYRVQYPKLAVKKNQDSGHDEQNYKPDEVKPAVKLVRVKMPKNYDLDFEMTAERDGYELPLMQELYGDNQPKNSEAALLQFESQYPNDAVVAFWPSVDEVDDPHIFAIAKTCAGPLKKIDHKTIVSGIDGFVDKTGAEILAELLKKRQENLFIELQILYTFTPAALILISSNWAIGKKSTKTPEKKKK